ncbi:hypothetical protein M422DRAFT_45499 [Sphaerobolus stellatus SS14]|uniref:Uncharacterized protein n=1 Tax=Sphaerobolus stellatus (strain SS14) TaxID=990650 RepID=A0A0C9W4Y1_SPHS4|nr:hypothetical protein M422DRAFT_45499 [Sphaerobolus stellatus SS14]
MRPSMSSVASYYKRPVPHLPEEVLAMCVAYLAQESPLCNPDKPWTSVDSAPFRGAVRDLGVLRLASRQFYRLATPWLWMIVHIQLAEDGPAWESASTNSSYGDWDFDYTDDSGSDGESIVATGDSYFHPAPTNGDITIYHPDAFPLNHGMGFNVGDGRGFETSDWVVDQAGGRLIPFAFEVVVPFVPEHDGSIPFILEHGGSMPFVSEHAESAWVPERNLPETDGFIPLVLEHAVSVPFVSEHAESVWASDQHLPFVSEHDRSIPFVSEHDESDISLWVTEENIPETKPKVQYLAAHPHLCKFVRVISLYVDWDREPNMEEITPYLTALQTVISQANIEVVRFLRRHNCPPNLHIERIILQILQSPKLRVLIMPWDTSMVMQMDVSAWTSLRKLRMSFSDQLCQILLSGIPLESLSILTCEKVDGRDIPSLPWSTLRELSLETEATQWTGLCNDFLEWQTNNPSKLSPLQELSLIDYEKFEVPMKIARTIIYTFKGHPLKLFFLPWVEDIGTELINMIVTAFPLLEELLLLHHNEVAVWNISLSEICHALKSLRHLKYIFWNYTPEEFDIHEIYEEQSGCHEKVSTCYGKAVTPLSECCSSLRRVMACCAGLSWTFDMVRTEHGEVERTVKSAGFHSADDTCNNGRIWGVEDFKFS